MKREHAQLPQVAFGILLALSLRERHGYEIIKQIEEDSAGRIRLSPGALYTSIKNLHEQRLIEEVRHRNEPRRRYYRLTKSGTNRLAAEVEYYRNSVQLARQRQVLEFGYGFAI